MRMGQPQWPKWKFALLSLPATPMRRSPGSILNHYEPGCQPAAPMSRKKVLIGKHGTVAAGVEMHDNEHIDYVDPADLSNIPDAIGFRAPSPQDIGQSVVARVNRTQLT